MKRQREAHGKSTHNKRGKVYKILFLVRVRVRVLSCKAAAPTSQIYLNISTFYHRPAVSVSCSCVRCACGGGAVVVCSNVFLCGCLLCIFSRPCARWLTVQKCLRRCLACACVRCGASRWCNLCVSVICLCWDISAVRPVVNHTKLCRKTVCSRASLSVCLSLCAYVLM